MKIESFAVTGMHGTRGPIYLDFQKDLNILSGRNGAGKTTILKMIWYFISGNLEKALIEVPFKAATLHTDLYVMSVTVNENQDKPFEVDLKIKSKNALFNPLRQDEELDKVNSNVKHLLTKYMGGSYFFPTFRIIEGGFTIEKYGIKHELMQSLLTNKNNSDSNSIDLINDFKALSTKLSNNSHKFITSVSASYINEILISKYAEIMSLTQPYQQEIRSLTDKIIENVTIKKGQVIIEEKLKMDAVTEFQKEVIVLEDIINNLKKPLKRFHDSMKFFIKSYEFHFSKNVQFYDNRFKEELPEPNNIEKLLGIDFRRKFHDLNILSSGEKQILNLVAYNSFFDDTIFFIDEPEISLHADWQRILFRILMKQNPTNQFIISTHSPFIYSKYPDKELCIDPKSDRGNEDGYLQ
ncbi:AAA family ATPase [Acinetobacter nosocomialis]|uniref:AAA family ATPase n=1 Tax=Acinetobacter nosocomialis TaxID=106654 RepID=UPI000DE73043|nr:AAA family ATPase [Acinetobacter nosocomialis]SSV47908.1 putative ATP-binding protein involved in virulence [Acinetobacter nosocomialis]